MLKPPGFKVSSETQRIIDLMVERMQTDNPVITLLEIKQITGRPIERSRGAVYTARKRIRNEYGRWYGSDPGIGYRIIPDEELPACGKHNRSRARNIHRETIKIMAIADPLRQTHAARTRTILERSIAELGLAATAPSAVKKVEQIVTRSHNELTSEQQVDAIKDALGQRR